jgi:Uma2 family endonuclease
MAKETLSNFTYDDLLEMPDDGRHYEILDGELIVNAAPNLHHQRIVGRIYSAIFNYLERQPIGEVFISPVDVVFTQRWVVEPDVVYVRNERKSILTKANVSGAPDLAVEVLSHSTRRNDEIIKRHAYENFGVIEYWIVDPELESIKVYRRNDGERYQGVVEVSTETKGATVSTPLLPGLEFFLEKLFAQ